MTDDRNALRAEAVDIFLRLDDAPEDESALELRDAFIARGPAARQAYESVVESWAVSRPKKRRRRNSTGLAVLAIAALAGAGGVLGPGLVVGLQADHLATDTPQVIALSSGDLVHLDAGSAIVERIEDDKREVEVLRGAAFFEVIPDTRPFIVVAEGVEARATGTAFAVETIRSNVMVGINEGSVDLRFGTAPLSLQAGEVVRVSGTRVMGRAEVDPETIAGWRFGKITLLDAPLSTLVAALDRRLGRTVVILNESLAHARITGVFSLDDPIATLRLAASLHGATVIAAPPLITVVTR